MVRSSDLRGQKLALELRDAALRLAKKRGNPQKLGLFRFLILEEGHLRVAYRAPVQAGLPRVLGHGIEVYFKHRKVLAVEWDAITSTVNRFRRGPWENFLDANRRFPPPWSACREVSK